MENQITATKSELAANGLNAAIPKLAQIICLNKPNLSLDRAESLAKKEIFNFMALANKKPDLLGCTPLSIALAVQSAIIDNLTLAESAGLVYLIPGRVKVGVNGNTDVYEWQVNYSPTANGLISIAMQSGSILDHKRPVCTYDASGKVETVTFEYLKPSYGAPRWESVTFNKIHFERLRIKSGNKNGGLDKANPNYTSWQGGIDPEFAGTKAIKHALNKLGTNPNAPNVQQPYQVISEPIHTQAIEVAKKEPLKIDASPFESTKSDPILSLDLSLLKETSDTINPATFDPNEM